MSESDDGRAEGVTIGVVFARSGRLANLGGGNPLDSATTLLRPALVSNPAVRPGIRLASRVSRSCAEDGQRSQAGWPRVPPRRG